jgi:hypothetical protein
MPERVQALSRAGAMSRDPANAGAIAFKRSGDPLLGDFSGLSDEVRSYDLVWLLHLVGDVHQPLHATSRFSRLHTAGDQGGNLETVIPVTGEVAKLHGYWDGLLGGSSTPEGAIDDALTFSKLPDPDPLKAKESDPEVWLTESEKLAEAFAYADPVKHGTAPYVLTRQYETYAKFIAREQAALGGARLAGLLNEALK